MIPLKDTECTLLILFTMILLKDTGCTLLIYFYMVLFRVMECTLFTCRNTANTWFRLKSCMTLKMTVYAWVWNIRRINNYWHAQGSLLKSLTTVAFQLILFIFQICFLCLHAAFVLWAKQELQYFVGVFSGQVFVTKYNLSTVAECVTEARNYCQQVRNTFEARYYCQQVRLKKHLPVVKKYIWSTLLLPCKIEEAHLNYW